MTEVAITPRGFRNNPGRHKELLVQYGLTPRYPAVDRPLSADELAQLIARLQGCHRRTRPGFRKGPRHTGPGGRGQVRRRHRQR